MRLPASRTFQLDEGVAGLYLVDEVREPAVTPGAPDRHLSDVRHLGIQRGRSSSRSTALTKASSGWAPESGAPLTKKAGVPLTPSRVP